jgi:hypothetical protein
MDGHNQKFVISNHNLKKFIDRNQIFLCLEKSKKKSSINMKLIHRFQQQVKFELKKKKPVKRKKCSSWLKLNF